MIKNIHPGRILLALLISCLATPALHAQQEGEDPDVPGIVGQDEPQDALTEYMNTMGLVDGLQVYNQQLQVLLEDQQREMDQLNASIEQASFIERQIGPLTERMIDTLAAFIELDIPFLLEQRREKIRTLRSTLDRSDISATEKFREVLRAYQEEIDYGSTKEAYVDIIEIEGQRRQVDMLRWGRVVLAFQTPDGALTGAWDNKARDWKILGEDFRVGIRDGLRIARKTMTDDLVILPTPAPEAN